MEQIVVDSNVLIAYLVDSEPFHLRAQQYISGLENGDCAFHLPMLAVVEVTSAVTRRSQRNGLALLSRWQKTVIDWERDGKILLYPLDHDRMDSAVNAAQRHRLRGADSVIVALAEELDMPLKTFDVEILARFLGSSV